MLKRKRKKIDTPTAKGVVKRADARREARADIVAAANAHSRALDVALPSYSLRRLDQAVCVVRRNRLVKPATLEAAGFRAVER